MFLDKSQEEKPSVVFQDIKVGLIPSWIRLVFLFFFDERGILSLWGRDACFKPQTLWHFIANLLNASLPLTLTMQMCLVVVVATVADIQSEYFGFTFNT